MRILIIGTGNPMPSFISRRLRLLAETKLKLIVGLAYGQSHNLGSNIQVIRYGDLDKMALADVMGFVLSVMLHPLKFFHVFRMVEASKYSTRLKLATRFFPLTNVRDITLIHLQWLGWVPDLYWLKTLYRVPLVASARGSQVTVYPYTQPGYGDVIRKALRLVDSCHLVSADLHKAVLALGADEKKLFVNYNGIDLNRFKPTTQRDSADRTIELISVGALIWRKGYIFQLCVLQELLARNISAALTIVGEGVDRDGLRYMGKALGLQEYLTFTGQLTESEIAARLNRSDVYLSTSLAEGLPNSVVEAAACGLPVVAFDCEGIKEVIEHGVSGYVVTPGKIGEMVNSIEMLQDNALRSRMGQCARQRMEAHFDQNKCVGEMIAHYQRMINAG